MMSTERRSYDTPEIAIAMGFIGIMVLSFGLPFSAFYAPLRLLAIGEVGSFTIESAGEYYEISGYGNISTNLSNVTLKLKESDISVKSVQCLNPTSDYERNEYPILRIGQNVWVLSSPKLGRGILLRNGERPDVFSAIYHYPGNTSLGMGNVVMFLLSVVLVPPLLGYRYWKICTYAKEVFYVDQKDNKNSRCAMIGPVHVVLRIAMATLTCAIYLTLVCLMILAVMTFEGIYDWPLGILVGLIMALQFFPFAEELIDFSNKLYSRRFSNDLANAMAESILKIAAATSVFLFVLSLGRIVLSTDTTDKNAFGSLLVEVVKKIPELLGLYF